MTRPAKFLIGTIIVGVLVLFLCARVLRPGGTSEASDPFDAPAADPFDPPASTTTP
jgi:hypothetical protein